MKATILALAIGSLGIVSSQAVSTINYDFGTLNDLGAPLADGNVVYLFASTQGAAIDYASLESSLLGQTLNVGSFFGTGNQILSVSTPNIASFGVEGTGNGVASNISYTGNLGQGDSLGLLWLTQAQGVIVAGSRFGVYVSPSLAMPADPSSVSRSFLELQFGGTIPDGGLSTTNTVVPEPSAALLGALGALGLLRRRRN